MHPTPEQKAEFGTLYLGGLTSQQIADLYDCSYVTVLAYLRSCGIPKEMRGVKLGKNFKLCRSCKLQLSINKFEDIPRDRKRNICVDCRAAQKAAFYQTKKEEKCLKRRTERKESPEKYRGQLLQKKFKLTILRFEEILSGQNDRCMVCKTTEPKGHHKQWHIDHDHACCPNGQKTCGNCIRGILCSSCNTALGHAKDNPVLLRALADYLEQYEERKSR